MCVLFFWKNIFHALQVYPFLSHLYNDGHLSSDVNRLSYDKHKTTFMNLEMKAFCLPFVFCSGQSYLKTSGPSVTS